MRKQIALAPVVLVAALSLSIALVDRIKERVAQDRLSFGDSSATELVSNQAAIASCEWLTFARWAGVGSISLAIPPQGPKQCGSQGSPVGGSELCNIADGKAKRSQGYWLV